jgi:hypothetical protein
VVNLFSYRTTDALNLLPRNRVVNPVGPETDAVIRRRVHTSELIVAGWGAGRTAELSRMIARRGRYVLHELVNRPVGCLGSTSLGHPRHPLYVKADVTPHPYNGPFIDGGSS